MWKRLMRLLTRQSSHEESEINDKSTLFLEREQAKQQKELWDRLDRIREQLATIDRRKGDAR